MSTEYGSKINRLLQNQPYGVVLVSSWLREQGYSYELQKRYKASKWLEPLGPGAMKRTGDYIDIEGALYTLQKQHNLSVHLGAKSALAVLGRLHYLDLNQKVTTLFAEGTDKLPKWFTANDWGAQVKYCRSGFLPGQLGLIDIEHNNFEIKISGPVRAMFECLYLAPREQELLECYELMEGMNDLRPAMVQQMLEVCDSVKVKRLFLYMAEKSGHSWFKYLKRDRINLGAGKRSIVPNGTYVPKYQITIPKDLAEYGSGI